MPRRTPWPPPVYSRAGSDYVRVRIAPGKYRDITLGPAGSPEARSEYLRLVAEMEQNGRQLPLPKGDVTVLEAAVAYLRWAQGYHEHRQYHRIIVALRPVRELYGRTPLRDFGPLALRAVRERYVEAGYARVYANRLTDCVRAFVRWAAGEQLVPYAVADALQGGKKAAVPGLRKRKTTAPEVPKVRPADPEAVAKTLPHLLPIPRDMVQLQLLTGMRPGEACALKPEDIDQQWQVIDGVQMWLARFDEHKGDWRGHHRWIPIGPRGQELLRPYLVRAPDAYCFSPREAREAQQAARTKARPIPLWKQRGNQKPGPKPARKPRQGTKRRAPRTCYTTGTYDRAVLRACTAAGVEPWSPNQLRHLVGTQVETEYGREDARCVLGHRNPAVTAIYAESVERAARIIARRG